MKCLVTGAAGFIGSHLVDRLLREGHEVVGVDHRFKEGYTHEVFFLQEPGWVLEDFDGVDWVFHLAARTGLQPWSSFQGYLEDNVLGTQRLLEACRQYCPRLKRFVYASTSSVYGREAVGDENTDKYPISPYGMTKSMAEDVVGYYCFRKYIPCTILRYFSVYGPRQREGMAIRRWIDQALRGEPLQVCKGSLSHTRSLTYVDDVIEATALAAQRDEAVGEAFNVAGLGCYNIGEVCQSICRTADKNPLILDDLPTREGDQLRTFGDWQKAYRLLGWQPKVGLTEGLRRQVEWQRNLMEDKR